MLIENNESFLSELSNMFNLNRSNNKSLYLTMKRYDGRNKPKKQPSKSKDGDRKDLANDKKDKDVQYTCMIRAKIGSKKISTIVHQKDINKFQLAYSNLLKGNLYGLAKKREVKN